MELIHQAQKKALRKTDVRRMIKEYAGTEYYFLSDYINGGWEDYLLSNMDDIVNKVTTIVVHGVRKTRSKYKSKNRYSIECEIYQTCENTVNYIKLTFDGWRSCRLNSNKLSIY